MTNKPRRLSSLRFLTGSSALAEGGEGVVSSRTTLRDDGVAASPLPSSPEWVMA